MSTNSTTCPDDAIICFNCRQKGEAAFLEDDNYNTCESCNWAFHQRCFAKRVVPGKSNKCCTYVAQSTFTLKDTCSKFSAEIKAIKESLGDLGDKVVSEELDEMKSDIKDLNDRSDQSIADVIDEIALRKRKQGNVMFYNMPDRNKQDLDKKNINKILNTVGITDTDFTFSRIGDFIENESRPTVVSFKNQETAKKVMGERNNIVKISAGSSTAKKIAVSTDKTKYQRQLLKSSIALLDKKRKDGEENLQIKYINGNPIITKRKGKKSTPVDPNSTVLY